MERISLWPQYVSFGSDLKRCCLCSCATFETKKSGKILVGLPVPSSLALVPRGLIPDEFEEAETSPSAAKESKNPVQS